MTHHVAACGDDGSLRLTLLFEKGTDLNQAQCPSRQNRIAQAEPALPEAGPPARRHGARSAASTWGRWPLCRRC